MKLDLVLVEAYDLETTAGWITKSDRHALMNSPGKKIVSVGWLIRNDEKAVVIAASLGETDEHSTDESEGDVQIFPKGCVKSITHLRQSGTSPRIKKFLKW